MFGYGNEGGGSCMVTDQISYNEDQDWIKQEHKVGNFNCFEDQKNGFINNYNDEKQKGCLMIKNLEEVKQLIGINNSRSSSINVDIMNGYLMNDDENKTTHIDIITDGWV